MTALAAPPKTGHWRLEDIRWTAFNPTAVDAGLLAAVKTAALVEANSADYVDYLHNVFAADPSFRVAATQWGAEESQHGQALGRWAELADPGFDFAASLARFRAGYRIPLDTAHSVRGSTAGELLARCVVESGTCSYYAAIRDYTHEPVLKQICHRIAQDEAQHYRLFHAHYVRYAGTARLSLWRRLRIALGRVGEADDDELAFAYFSANLAPASAAVYDREQCGRTYQRIATAMYRMTHVRTLTAMIAYALGFNPGTWMVRASGRLGWWWMSLRSRQAPRAS